MLRRVKNKRKIMRKRRSGRKERKTGRLNDGGK
jgi:hypothetical protein